MPGLIAELGLVTVFFFLVAGCGVVPGLVAGLGLMLELLAGLWAGDWVWYYGLDLGCRIWQKNVPLEFLADFDWSFFVGGLDQNRQEGCHFQV